jgi:hypothetical protein
MWVRTDEKIKKGLETGADLATGGFSALPLLAAVIVSASEIAFPAVIERIIWTLGLTSFGVVGLCRWWRWMGSKTSARAVESYLGLGVATGVVFGGVSGAFPPSGLDDHVALIASGVVGGLWGSFVFWFVHHPSWADEQIDPSTTERDENQEQHPQ